jgi:2-polyprenyl-3-methyl-5-hydroxy-6-metoxy-1,4-benzoquinol methylase
MGVTRQPIEDDLFFDQKWGTCDDCGLLQLLELLPLDILYSENHFTEAVGETWNSHHDEFANFISASTRSKVLEIGGAHGELARRLLRLQKDIQYTFVEPSPGKLPEECKVVVGYIEDHLDLVSKNDSVVHSHVLEHMYTPAKFISEVAHRMKLDSKMFISYPNIEQLLVTGGTNSLNFEHTYFLTPNQLEVVGRNSGLELTRASTFRKHSFFWELTKKENISNSLDIPNIQSKNLLFESLWQSLKDFVNDCNKKLGKTHTPTYIFGAHIFSQGLINLGLVTESINGILDNAADKQGKRLYGTTLKVSSPDIIKNLPSVRVILRATHYQEEIKNQLKALNPAVEILE